MKTYTAKQVAELLQISTNQVHYLVRQGKLPKPIIKTESVTRWRAADIDSLLEKPCTT